MKAEVNPLGKLEITVGYNFTIPFGTDQIKMDEQASITAMRTIVGKPFRNTSGEEIGRVISVDRVFGQPHFFLRILVHDKFKDDLLKQLELHKHLKSGASMEVKSDDGKNS